MIGNGRWDQWLARLFGVKGQMIAPSVAGEIVPVALIQPDSPELEWLRATELRCNQLSLSAGGVGNYGIARVFNSGVQKVVVVDRLICVNFTAAARLFYCWTGAPWSTGIAAQEFGMSRDRPRVTDGSSAGRVDRGLATAPDFATGAFVAAIGVPANSSAEFVFPWILFPNQFITVIPGDANVAWEFTAVWRERPFDIGEER